MTKGQKSGEYEYIQDLYELELMNIRNNNRKRKARGYKILYPDVHKEANKRVRTKHKIFKAERTINYIVFREYLKEKYNPAQLTIEDEPNQRVTTEGNKNVKTKKQGINQNVKTCV